MITPHIAQITRTGEKDARGNPIYNMQAQPLVKIKKTV